MTSHKLIAFSFFLVLVFFSCSHAPVSEPNGELLAEKQNESQTNDASNYDHSVKEQFFAEIQEFHTKDSLPRKEHASQEQTVEKETSRETQVQPDSFSQERMTPASDSVPEVTPELLPDSASEVTPDSASELLSEVTPDSASELLSEVTPELISEQRPDASQKPLLPTWKDNPCTHLSGHKINYTSLVSRWTQQAIISSPPKHGLVVVGSSSIRFWKRLQKDFTAWQVIQRGFGGARLWDVVAHSSQLIIAHQPRAVLLFAGTNDVAAGTTPSEIMFGYRCLVQNIRKGIGHIPIIFISITPTPSRWSRWSQSSKVNVAVKALAAQWSGLHYIDTTAAFLKTGQPPSSSLFRSDLLHLNPAGYKLWTSIIRPYLKKVVPPLPYTAPKGQPPSGSRVLIDLGARNPQDGALTPSPDSLGQHWNNWHYMQGGSTNTPGEALGLLSTKGTLLPWRWITSGIFSCNGIRNGGLLKPKAKNLGHLAIGTATQDYFYVSKQDDAGFVLTGLDPSKLYGMRLFGSRAFSNETRTTRYTISSGTKSIFKMLITTGNNIGSDGIYDGNDDTIVSFKDIKPDAWGKIHIDVSAEAGAFGYISLVELQVQ